MKQNHTKHIFVLHTVPKKTVAKPKIKPPNSKK